MPGVAQHYNIAVDFACAAFHRRDRNADCTTFILSQNERFRERAFGELGMLQSACESGNALAGCDTAPQRRIATGKRGDPICNLAQILLLETQMGSRCVVKESKVPV